MIKVATNARPFRTFAAIGLVATTLLVGCIFTDEARRNGLTVENDPSAMQFALGVFESFFALGFLGAGVADLATGEDPTALKRYYRETYEAR